MLYIFIQENAFENVTWKMAAFLSRPQYVKKLAWFEYWSYMYVYYTYSLSISERKFKTRYVSETFCIWWQVTEWSKDGIVYLKMVDV